jgi:hypothetical protein
LQLYLIRHPTVSIIIEKDTEEHNHHHRNQPRDTSFLVNALAKNEEDKSQERDEDTTIDAL